VPTATDPRPAARTEPARSQGRAEELRTRSEKIRLRRGVSGVLMTLVLPGSAQLAAGNRTVGRIALRVWVALWVLLIALGVTALVNRSFVVSLASTSWVLGVLQVLLVVVGLGWAGLLVDAWRLGRPAELAHRHRPGYAVLSLALVVTVLFASIAGARTVAAHQELMDHLFAGGGDAQAEQGRYNIMLLGADAGASRVGLRPDSITVASISIATGRTVLFSLPRNMEDVPFPEDSPMHAAFPNGFTCGEHECMLNGIYTWASEHKDLYPDAKDPGAEATREAVSNLLGIKINYYAMVDLKGFEALVDAVGGINLDINKRVPIGGGTSPIKGWIEKGKNVHLDGYHALWFARSREGANDYERMARQKCVMVAMLNQLDPMTVLTKFTDIAKAGEEIAATDIPQSETGALVDLAVKARGAKIASVSFVPPLIYPGSPNFGLIRTTVADHIAVSEAEDRGETPAPSTTPTKKPDSEQPASGKPKSTATAKSTTSLPAGSNTTVPETEDLGAICKAR